MPSTSTTITFEGLLVFHQDQSDLFEVGILETKSLSHLPEHFFQIIIVPDPHTHQGKFTLGPADLDVYLQKGKHWTLEVEDSEGNPQTGIEVDPSLPPRKDTSQVDKRYGWIINLESSEFHQKQLIREKGKLKPVIHLTKGKLNTFCKTGSIDVIQGGATKDFGFIAAQLALEIDTSAGEEPVLKVDNTEIFRLPRGFSYQVAISNTTLLPPTDSHFHAYYDLLFTGVPGTERFGLAAQNGVASPNPCPNRLDLASSKHDSHGDRGETNVFDPPPFRCGGIGINLGGDPLE